MYKPLAIVVLLSAVGLYFAATLHGAKNDRKASCLEEVAKLDASYKNGRAGAGVQERVEQGVPVARRYCEEGKFDEAARLVNAAGLACRLNNGCPVTRTR
jgi:hypothetical protein